MTDDSPIRLPPELVNLDRDAVALAETIRRINRIPEHFPVDDALELCRAARDVARSDKKDRPQLLQVLQEQLASIRSTVPRDEDEATGEPEYRRLRYALSELTSEASACILAGRDHPDPAYPEDPRTGTPGIEAREICKVAKEVPNAAEQVEMQICGNSDSRVRKVEFNLIKVVNSGRASARLVGVAVQKPGTVLKRISTLGKILCNWERSIEKILKISGLTLKFFGDALPHFAKLSEELGDLCIRYSKNENVIEDHGNKDDPKIEELMHLLESYLIRGDESKAHEVAERLKSADRVECIAQSFEMNLNSWRVNDISVLKCLPSLRSLSLMGASTSDISVLSNFSKLLSLNISRSKVSDLSALSDLTTLQSLYVSVIHAKDYSGDYDPCKPSRRAA
jgi:hypothetical protein